MATWDAQEKPGILAGGGWDYDEDQLEYDSDEDPESSAQVVYNGEGEDTNWTNENETI